MHVGAVVLPRRVAESTAEPWCCPRGSQGALRSHSACDGRVGRARMDGAGPRVRPRRVRRHRVRRGVDRRASGRARAAGTPDRARRAVAGEAGGGPGTVAGGRRTSGRCSRRTRPTRRRSPRSRPRTRVGRHDRRALRPVRAAAGRGLRAGRDALRGPDRRGVVRPRGDRPVRHASPGRPARGSCTPAATTRCRRTWPSCCCTSARPPTARAGSATCGSSRPPAAGSAAGRSTRSARRSTRCAATRQRAGWPPIPSR